RTAFRMYKKPSTARRVKHAYESLLEANLRDKVPAWLHAMRSAPPSVSTVRDPTIFSTKGKLAFERNEASAAAEQGPGGKIERKLPVGCVSIRHKKSSLRTRSPKPPKITFPEDGMRREFYKKHPFEALRPRIVMEPNGETVKDWSKITQGSGQVSGEQVVRYQYYLMQAEGLSVEEAYAKATSEFYKLRAREEIEAKIASQEAKSYGACALDKPYSAYQLAMEESEIRRSSQIIKRRQEEQRMRSVTSEKMFAESS
ncbi:mitochondrial ribosomal small subunit component, partial [Dipsacomyces acuminosporus]